MTQTTPLRRLAAEAGIVPAYHDVFGERHEASEAMLRELLAALEVLAEPAADAAAALAAWDAARGGETLPPVQVVWQHQPAAVRLLLPAGWLDQRLYWEIAQEDGHRRFGEVLAADCRRGGERQVEGEGELRLELDWPLPFLPPPGYHRLVLKLADETRAEMSLIVAPSRCYQPPAVRDGQRVWGPALQLYTLCSERNWGIGDFTDLRRFAELWREQGADIVGLNPLHALFLGNPAHASPYSPSSRRFC